MLAVVGVALSCLLVLTFYGYVFVQLYREHKRFGSLEKRLNEHFLATGSTPEIKAKRPKRAASPSITGRARKETLFHVGVAVGGFLGVFAEIGLLNWAVTSFHE